MGRPALHTIRMETTERLLRAAERRFADDGLEGARLADIAEDAGITRASLLYHFEAKEQLYLAVVERAFASLAEIVTSATQSGGPYAARLRAVVEGFLTFVEVHPHFARIIVREVVEARGPGRALLLSAGVPLIDLVVGFVEREGGAALRRGVPVRAALLQVVASTFLRAASGDLRRPFWGDEEATWPLAAALFLDTPASVETT